MKGGIKFKELGVVVVLIFIVFFPAWCTPSTGDTVTAVPPSTLFEVPDATKMAENTGNIPGDHEWNGSIDDYSAPVAYATNITVNENSHGEILLSGTDPDGNLLTYHTLAGPYHGSLQSLGGNCMEYSPEKDFYGRDTFTFSASDGTWCSDAASVSITVLPSCSDPATQEFYGNVTIGGAPAPENTVISVIGESVSTACDGNPLVLQVAGRYGGKDVPELLVVQGCIPNGTPLAFFIEGKRAEVLDVNTGTWQYTYPFEPNVVTHLDLRLTREVIIEEISATIKNTAYGLSTTIKVVKDPNLELRVTPGIFTISLSAIGVHGFEGLPQPGRIATLGIYENGVPLSPEKQIWFGSNIVSYRFIPVETRTFDILIAMNDQPEIYDIKHVTVHTYQSSVPTASSTGENGSGSNAREMVIPTENNPSSFSALLFS